MKNLISFIIIIILTTGTIWFVCYTWNEIDCKYEKDRLLKQRKIDSLENVIYKLTRQPVWWPESKRR